MDHLATVRCAACALDIVTQGGHYRLVDRYYHPECFDRMKVATPHRTLWALPPLPTSSDVPDHNPVGIDDSMAPMSIPSSWARKAAKVLGLTFPPPAVASADPLIG